MSSKSHGLSLVSERYAAALIDLAEESGKTEQIEKDLESFLKLMRSSEELNYVVKSPLVGRGEQLDAVLAIAEKAGFEKLTANFLGTLAKNRRLSSVEGITDSVKALLAKRRGEVQAKVRVAQDLSNKQVKELEESLSKAAGAKVSVDLKIEPGIIGGMVVTIGSRMIDDSVSRKLEKLGNVIRGSANEDKKQKLSKVG